MADVGGGSGSDFQGLVEFGNQTFGDVLLRFQSFGAPNTSLNLGINSTEQKIDGTNCKPSCTLLQYSGMVDAIRPRKHGNPEKWNLYAFTYEFSEHKGKVFEEYLIYDGMGMIGSVGGTLGMFIGFSMDGVVTWAIGYIKKRKTQ